MSRPSEHRPLVWITDDSPVEARITQHALGSAYDYEHFCDGSVVIERLTAGTRQPDVLLLDWVMPGVTGDEVCRFLRSQPHTRELPIILLTASRVETADIVAGLASGANDYVARPFAEAELRARVDNAIRAKRMRETAARERNRLNVINKLGRSFVDVGGRLEAVLEMLATSLVDGLVDGCTITALPGVIPGTTIARHRTRLGEHLLTAFTAADPCNLSFTLASDARAALPGAYHPAIARFGMGALAVIPFAPRSPIAGMVTVMRDAGGPAFEPEDIVTIETCLEYAAMAFEKALRFDAEQAIRKQLQTILEHLPISIIVAEPSGAITHINQTALALGPAIRSQTITGIHERMQLRDLEGRVVTVADSPIARALEGETVRGIELEATFDDAKPRFLRTSAVPIYDTKGAVSSAILAIDDITAERLAAAERERAMEFQRYVLGIVSHDLRSPLQTLMMGCEGIRMQSADNPKVMQYLTRMENTAARMRGIIEQLLDVVRTQLGGGIPVTPTDVNINELVTSVLGEMSLAHPGTELNTKLADVRGVWDRDRLAQVLSNLVGNAIQHGVKGGPIWIETGRADDSAVIHVRNKTLTPLTPEQMATIFEPFRRTKHPVGGSGGLGLGLYIASEIVRAHGGRLAVDSDPALTTFTVQLPLRPPGTATA